MPPEAPSAPPTTGFLDTAVRIGLRLVRDAFWTDDRCAWFGWSSGDAGNAWATVYKNCGPGLYEGTSGIALFLVPLACETGDDRLRRTAVGALHHALHHSAEPPEPHAVGVYGGRGGIGYAFLRAGRLLEHDALIDRGLEVLQSVAHVPPAATPLDVIGGSAGLVPVFLHAAYHHDRPDLANAAVAHADRLLDEAVRTDAGWSWETMPPEHTLGNLLGYSHGTAGIAVALAEVAVHTGAERFWEGALQALRYEADHYHETHANWPDLRAMPSPGQPAPTEPSYMNAWCHGAPGGVLARLRLTELLRTPNAPEALREPVQRTLDAALQTTAASVQGAATGLDNDSLCHGHGGNADVLLEAARVLDRPLLRETAGAVGHREIERVAATHSPWPCGTATGAETPSLMLGLAGIGHFYHRLAAPDDVESVLLIRGGEA